MDDMDFDIYGIIWEVSWKQILKIIMDILWEYSFTIWEYIYILGFWHGKQGV